MFRLLLDQGPPRTAAVILRQRGVDAAHVGELGLARKPDNGLLELARREGRVVCTLDADSHQWLALRRWAFSGAQ
jgi:predicted nuclease of predicted toxin-antitoxin system